MLHGYSMIKQLCGELQVCIPLPAFELVLTYNVRTAKTDMILMLVPARVHAGAYALCMMLPYVILMTWRPITQA